MTDQPPQEKDNKSTSEVTDMIDAVFKKVFNDRTINPTIQKILGQLRTPYLKLAIETPNLFALESHQARVFLKNILHISKNWNEKIDQNSSYIKKLSKIVTEVTNLDHYNNSLFLKLENDAKKHMLRLEKRLAVKQKRQKEKSQGQEKIQQANDNTQQCISNKIKNTNIPLFAKNILMDDWFNVLVLLNLRYGLNSEEYLSKLNFIDNLIKCSQVQADLQLTKSSLNELLSEYRKGLKLVAFNSFETDKKVNELHKNIKSINYSKKQLKSKIITDGNQKPVNVPAKKKNSMEKIVPKKTITKPNTTKPHVNSLIQEKNQPKKPDNIVDYSQIVSVLQKGDWLGFLTDDNKIIKAKLSWISPISEKYLFVDSNGLKLTDKSKGEIIKGLDNKTITLLKSF